MEVFGYHSKWLFLVHCPLAHGNWNKYAQHLLYLHMKAIFAVLRVRESAGVPIAKWLLLLSLMLYSVLHYLGFSARKNQLKKYRGHKWLLVLML